MPAHSDHSVAHPSLALESNVDADGAQCGLSATQSSGECPRAAGPIGAADITGLALQLVGRSQEVGRRSVPLIPIFHDVARACGYRIGLDDAFDDGLAIGSIGARNGASGPER